MPASGQGVCVPQPFVTASPPSCPALSCHTQPVGGHGREAAQILTTLLTLAHPEQRQKMTRWIPCHPQPAPGVKGYPRAPGTYGPGQGAGLRSRVAFSTSTGTSRLSSPPERLALCPTSALPLGPSCPPPPRATLVPTLWAGYSCGPGLSSTTTPSARSGKSFPRAAVLSYSSLQPQPPATRGAPWKLMKEGPALEWSLQYRVERRRVSSTQGFSGEFSVTAVGPAQPLPWVSEPEPGVLTCQPQCEAFLAHLVDRDPHLVVLAHSFRGSHSRLHPFHL